METKPKSWFNLMISLAWALSLGSLALGLSQGGLLMAANSQAQETDSQGSATNTALVSTVLTRVN